MGQIPTPTTTRLVLRPFTLDDAPTVHENVGKWDVARTIPNMPHPYEEGMAEEWIGTHETRYDNGGGISLAITLRADGLLIGGVGLRINSAFRSAEIGYWVSPSRWGQGYCTEAACETIRYPFVDLDLNRVEAHHMTKNPASGRVMQKLGMLPEGILRQAVYKSGDFEDVALYAILREDHVAGGRAR